MNIWIKPDSITFEDRHFIFKNKLAYLMLESLYQKSLSQEALTFSNLEKAIKEIRPNYSLKRMQSSRMISEIEKAIDKLSLPIRLEYFTRNKTVGPWFLSVDKNVIINSAGTDNNQENMITNSYLLTNDGVQTESLQQFLSYWVQSFSAFDLGLIDYAIDKLENCYKISITPFAKCFIDLYKARLYTRKGKYQTAEKIILNIIENPHISKQSHIISFAKIMLTRIKYEYNPAGNFNKLLGENIPPKKYYQEDILSLMEWHNIQSLLLKRKLLNTHNKQKVIELHKLILSHLQEAILISIVVENRSRFLDYCSNYALYLQNVIPLGLSSIQEVLKWYQLNAIFSNKLSVGDYSIWSDIFYTQFYLKYREEIITKKLNFFGPDKEEFYINILTKAKNCGNDRQIIIFYLCYFEFACNNLSEDKVKRIANNIIFFLQQNSELCEDIKLDGYANTLDIVYHYKDDELLLLYQKQAKDI